MSRYAKSRSDQEKKEIYDKWQGLINMSQKSLDSWAENDDRLLASINRNKAKEEGGIQSGYDSFHRIKRRKSKKFEDWSAQDFDNASQENGFNSRMLGGQPGDPVEDSGMSKWEISLKNWGHDPSLKSSPQHTKWKAWKMKHTKKSSIQRVSQAYLIKQSGVIKLPQIRIAVKVFFLYAIAKRFSALKREGVITEINDKRKTIKKIEGMLKQGHKIRNKQETRDGYFSLLKSKEGSFPYDIPLESYDYTIQAQAFNGQSGLRGSMSAGASTGERDDGVIVISLFEINSIAIRMAKNIDNEIKEVSRLVDHESIHYVQKVLRRRTPDPKAGIPRSQETTPEYSQRNTGRGDEDVFTQMGGNSIHHALDDVEFFPHVRDLITNTLRTLEENLSDADKLLKLFDNEKALSQATLMPMFNHFRETELRYLDRSMFNLLTFKQHAPKKHTRAMKELKKELRKEGWL